jgi:hypothetical protein
MTDRITSAQVRDIARHSRPADEEQLNALARQMEQDTAKLAEAMKVADERFRQGAQYASELLEVRARLAEVERKVHDREQAMSSHLPSHANLCLLERAEQAESALHAAQAERDAVKCDMGYRASECDVLNRELRENYGDQHQVEPDDDWRPAIRALVDGVRYGEQYQRRDVMARLATLSAALEQIKAKRPQGEMPTWGEFADSGNQEDSESNGYNLCAWACADLAEAALAGTAAPKVERPRVVCLCGSTRFKDAVLSARRTESLAGRIVVGPDLFGHAGDLPREMCERGNPVKDALDELHLRKIDLADEVLVLNVGGYVGDSTRSEIDYAKVHGKPIRWLETYAALAGPADKETR